MKEKRKGQRVAISQVIEYSMGREEFIPAQGINISEYGILFHADKKLERYARLYVLLAVRGSADDVSVPCEGVVVRCGEEGPPYEIAMEFADGCPLDMKRIRQMMASRSSA